MNELVLETLPNQLTRIETTHQKNELQQKLRACFITYDRRIGYNPGLKLRNPRRKCI